MQHKCEADEKYCNRLWEVQQDEIRNITAKCHVTKHSNGANDCKCSSLDEDLNSIHEYRRTGP